MVQIWIPKIRLGRQDLHDEIRTGTSSAWSSCQNSGYKRHIFYSNQLVQELRHYVLLSQQCYCIHMARLDSDHSICIGCRICWRAISAKNERSTPKRYSHSCMLPNVRYNILSPQCKYYHLMAHIIPIISYRNNIRQCGSCERLLDGHHRHHFQNPLFRQIDKSEQRFIIKFLFLKGIRFKAIHKNDCCIRRYNIFSQSSQERCAHFKPGDSSFECQSRFDHPPHLLWQALSDLLEDFPFATARIIMQYFS
jgi:ferredoxin